MRTVRNIITTTLRSALRDRILLAVIGAAAFIFLLVPAFSLFSMRQVQELSITLSLSVISFVLLIVSTLMGSSSVWRDIERRYAPSVLGLPISRSSYVVGKFLGTSIFILACSVILGLASLVVIKFSSTLYPSDLPIRWVNIISAVFADALKYILLVSVATFFSAISTSFFLPVFGTLAIYIAGSASQEVYEYISGDFGRSIPPLFLGLVKGVYFLVPNLGGIDLKVHAIYALPVSWYGLFISVAYCLLYIALVLFAAVAMFSRREIP